MKYYLPFILLLIKINSIEISLEKENLKDSMKIYDKLNFFETIDQNQYFIIYTKVNQLPILILLIKIHILTFQKTMMICFIKEMKELMVNFIKLNLVQFIL